MVDEPTVGGPMTEEEARRLSVAYHIEVGARGPAPVCEEQLAAILAEHEAECDRLGREQAEAMRRKTVG